MSNMYNIDGKPSSKVSRPPGGASSDIFGTDKLSAPHHANSCMASNTISGDQNAVKNSVSAPDYRRGQRNVDSYSRLFGDSDHSFGPNKHQAKSSMGIGGNDSTDKRNQANGFIYGSGHHEAQQFQKEQTEHRQEQQRQDREDKKNQARDQTHEQQQCRQEQQQSRQEQQQSRQEQQQSREEQQDQRQQVLDQREQALDQRQKAQDQQQLQQGNGNSNANGKSDGDNPVNGDGYNKNADMNTKPLNAPNQVVNRNRIPPGGYSSGLW